jgi:hypothetical protein
MSCGLPNSRSLPIGGLGLAERFSIKTSVQKPSGSASAAPLKQVPLDQLKHVAGGVAPARNPVTNPTGAPVL